MKKILFLFIIFASLTFLPANAQVNPNNFEFSLFEADYYLSRSDSGVGKLLIDEKLIAQFPDFDQNRGILRSIPLEYKGNDLDLKIISVVNEDGQAWNYTTYESGDQLVIQIGDADKYVRGEQEYYISYRVDGVISFYDGYDELFWDTNGTGWSQAFDQVIARFHIPNYLTDNLQSETKCFSGSFGSNSMNCEVAVKSSDDKTVVSATALNLSSGENLSVAMAFDEGTFSPDPWIAIKRAINYSGLILLPILSMAFSYREWKENGKDVGRRGVVVPQYDPPEELNLLETEVIINEKLSNQAVTAGILELAILGYIQIIQKTKKKLIGKDEQYSLKLIKDPADLSKIQQELIDMVFDNRELNQIVSLNDNKNKFYLGAEKLKKSVPKSLSVRSYFRADPVNARSVWLVKSIGLAILGVLILIFLGDNYPLFGVGALISGILMAFWSNAMPARTKKGSHAYEYLLGLKDYIDLAEEERLEFHQSPEGSRYGGKEISDNEFRLNLYENLLPYALLFGLSEKWSEAFKDIYQQPPDWYQGNSNSFNSLYLANSLNSMSKSAAQAFTPPSSSSSSGGSGFSGGGFSGGGGGGGGGGGW